MITNKDLFFVRMLTKISANMDNGLRCKHASLLVVDKNIVSCGLNKKKSHPEQKKFRRPMTYTLTNVEAIPYHFLHAEIDCLKNVEEINGRRSTIYVVRVDEKGELANSRPCEGCSKKINALKIKRIVHSVPGGIAEYLVEQNI